MRSTARQPAEEPAPTRESLEARAGRALDEHAAFLAEIRAVHAEIRDALRLLPAAACDQQLAATLAGRLEVTAEQQRHLWTMADDNSLHLEETRGAMAEFTAANAGNALLLAALRAREKSLEDAARQIPRQRGGGGTNARQGVLMRLHQGGKAAVVPVAAAFWAVTRPVRHVLAHHPAAVRLTARTVHLATGAAAGSAAAAVTAVMVLTPGVTSTGPGAHGHGNSAPGWRTSAVPIPSSSPVALSVLHPKARHGHGRRVLLSGAGVVVPPFSPRLEPASSSPPSADPASASAPAGPATLTVSTPGGTPTLDLSGDVTSATFTVTATGGGWASWRVSTAGTDLTFTPDHGVLQAGQFATVTVSRASVLDALRTQAFTVAGQSVVVTLPMPVPAVSVAPVASDLPTVLPSAPDPTGS